MGKEKYKKRIEELFSKSPVVSYSSISRIVKQKRNVKQYVKRLINYLTKRGEIKRLTKGYYTKLDDVSLIVFCFQPAYLGLQHALSFHNLWEQETIPVVITVRKVRPGIRTVLGKNVLIRRIAKKYFFGLDYERQDKIVLPYSDVEKTFLDMLYFKENLSDDALMAFKKRINLKRLKAYLTVYPENVKARVHSLL